MVQGVFIPSEPCLFRRKERLESPMLSAILMKGKYLLHIIHKIVSMVRPLRDLVYTYSIEKSLPQ